MISYHRYFAKLICISTHKKLVRVGNDVVPARTDLFYSYRIHIFLAPK